MICYNLKEKLQYVKMGARESLLENGGQGFVIHKE